MPAARRTGKVRAKRHRFTKEECPHGYQAALEKCSHDWELYAWLYYRIRGYYRGRKALLAAEEARQTNARSPTTKGPRS